MEGKDEYDDDDEFEGHMNVCLSFSLSYIRSCNNVSYHVHLSTSGISLSVSVSVDAFM